MGETYANKCFAAGFRSGDARIVAQGLNWMDPGTAVQFKREQIRQLKGDLHRNGWDIVLDNTMGSAVKECWTFREDPISGNMVCHKLPEDRQP